MLARCRTSLLFTLLGSLLLAGCRRSELVENELRARDIQYREALEELGRAEARNQSLQAEMEAVRKGAKLTPDQAAQLTGVRRIVLGRLTGGYDNDGLPGDEALQVVIEPRDSAERSLQALREVQITALEIDPRGVKTPIGEWTVAGETLRKSWKQGLLSIGYHVNVPWKRLPQSETVRVIVRTTLPSGASFEVDKDIKVRVVPGARSTPAPGELPGDASLELVPAHKQTSSQVPAGHWQAAPLSEAVQLGRPLPRNASQATGAWDE